MGKILVTGAAGFVGFHVCKELLKQNKQVIGIDNFNDYYNPLLKEKRAALLTNKNFSLLRQDFSDYKKLFEAVKDEDIDLIIHLGAQAGVRYSIDNPHVYEEANLKGTLAIFELARHKHIPKVVFASSSSVYGNTKKTPFSEEDFVDHPISLYAATKKANELMAYTYHHLYNIKMVGLRFFTVYGPWGRPDMAYFSFFKNIQEGKAIKVFNHGKMQRDFTFIADIVQGILAATQADLTYEIINLGNNSPEELGTFIDILEEEAGKKAVKEMLPMQPGDVLITYADISKAKKLLNYQPTTSLKEGLRQFATWYKENESWLKEL
ncbi:MAG: GDP-mannose 4,6-dehydratase [Candidatus Woesearchaeota archaeon]|nr:MAG: GDP-mannose 4,6-dehydratase [Candidatus Woesearchaeota archaeon]